MRVRAFTSISVSGRIAGGLTDVTPNAMARLTPPHMDPAASPPDLPEDAA